MTEQTDPLSETPTAKPKRVRTAKPAAPADVPARKRNGPIGNDAKRAAKRPSKAVTVEAPARKAKKAAAAEPAPAPRKPRPKAIVDDVSTLQPDDSVVLKAVKKLRGPVMAAAFAIDLGVHRRVIRAQLQRLAKEKANGVMMKKDGYNWIVGPR
jgi:hypothetical protein